MSTIDRCPCCRTLGTLTLRDVRVMGVDGSLLAEFFCESCCALSEGVYARMAPLTVTDAGIRSWKAMGYRPYREVIEEIKADRELAARKERGEL